MFKKIVHVPVTANSYPFAAAAEKCEFDKIGYIEDEYFMSGAANVYTEGPNFKPEVLFKDAPYTTRLIVRRPQDISRFSGNVVVEVLNASAMIDIDRMWVNSWKTFIRNGDIYVGITSKGHVVDSLLRFDAKRYEPICWANPMPERPIPESRGPFAFLTNYESGLFWDMLVDLAKLLREKSSSNPISLYGDNFLYLTGWSQSGGYLTRCVKSFAYLPENVKNGPLFDGYLGAGCGSETAPMNAYEASSFVFARGGIPKSSIMGAREPYININTESENRHTFWYGDFDQPAFKFRTYQIPGSSHDSYYNLIEYYQGQGQADLDRIKISNGYSGVDGEPMDYPYEVIFNAAFSHLYKWVREGIPAPHAQKIETEFTGPENADPFGAFVKNSTDIFGNAKGGIRTPALDYPTGKYTSFSITAEGRITPMFGKVNPFSADLLKQLYGSLENYRSLVTKRTDDIVSQGFILTGDRDSFIEAVVETARKRGLR